MKKLLRKWLGIKDEIVDIYRSREITHLEDKVKKLSEEKSILENRFETLVYNLGLRFITIHRPEEHYSILTPPLVKEVLLVPASFEMRNGDVMTNPEMYKRLKASLKKKKK